MAFIWDGLRDRNHFFFEKCQLNSSSQSLVSVATEAVILQVVGAEGNNTCPVRRCRGNSSHAQ